MKYEIAEELGLLEKVQKGGWKSLSSRETGKIGGILSTRRKAQAKKERPEQA
ncbi:MAG: small, acid-soluble spore protein, alpha/beta type [Lachnospiraceae bacterium]|nr:small, acid-soluble spore protein, alpha/beta type [Lachnospiraceae bacterium]